MPFLPESRGACRGQDGNRVGDHRVEQHAPPEPRPQPAEPAHDRMLEAVDRIAVRRRAGVQGCEERRIPRRVERFHLNPHIPVAHQVQHFGQQGDALAVSQAGLAQGPQIVSRYGAEAGQLGVVMDHDDTVPGCVYVELHPVRVQHDCSAECCEGVFVLVTGSAAMCDDAGSRHGRQR